MENGRLAEFTLHNNTKITVAISDRDFDNLTQGTAALDREFIRVGMLKQIFGQNIATDPMLTVTPLYSDEEDYLNVCFWGIFETGELAYIQAMDIHKIVELTEYTGEIYSNEAQCRASLEAEMLDSQIKAIKRKVKEN